MLASIRNRLILIGLIVAGCIYALFPREITTRVRGADGVMRDSVAREIPIHRGLDLLGGMHLALELDQSKQVSSNVSRDIDLALTVLRKRIDEFGVTEPNIQKVGDARIVVELAGITDPARAKEIVQQSAFLEFRITNETNAFEKALPAMARALRALGVSNTGAAGQPRPSAVAELLGGTDSTRRDSAGADSADSAAAAADTTILPGGALSSLIEPSGA